MPEADVLIAGGGPAGLTAALYSARRGLSTIVITQDIGGQASTTGTVENYPGVDFSDGLELMMKFKTQAEKYGAKIQMAEVQKIEQMPDGRFKLTTSGDEYIGVVVIMAYGLTHRHLNVPGEDKFIGRGVTYCATCDAPLYRRKNVVVVGGGNSAMDAALLLANLEARVTLLTHNTELHGERVLIDRIQSTPAITLVTAADVQKIHGSETVEEVHYRQGEQDHVVPATGVFVEIGFTVNPGLVRDLLALDGKNQIIINPADNSTNIPGLYAAGDVTAIPHKQIVISAGEGAKAGLGAYQYLQTIGKIKRGGIVDWGVSTPHRHESTPPKPSSA